MTASSKRPAIMNKIRAWHHWLTGGLQFTVKRRRAGSALIKQARLKSRHHQSRPDRQAQ